jgi:endoribonuclease L-PSP
MPASDMGKEAIAETSEDILEWSLAAHGYEPYGQYALRVAIAEHHLRAPVRARNPRADANRPGEPGACCRGRRRLPASRVAHHGLPGDLDDFAEMNAVYREFFDTRHPARATVGVAEMVGALWVEIDAVALIPSR